MRGSCEYSECAVTDKRKMFLQVGKFSISHLIGMLRNITLGLGVWTRVNPLMKFWFHKRLEILGYLRDYEILKKFQEEVSLMAFKNNQSEDRTDYRKDSGYKLNLYNIHHELVCRDIIV